MSKVEKEYQKRFSNKQENSSKFDNEDLWSEISIVIQPKKKDRRTLIFWLVYGLATIGILTTVLQHSDPNNFNAEGLNRHVTTEFENNKNRESTTVKNSLIAVIQNSKTNNGVINDHKKVDEVFVFTIDKKPSVINNVTSNTTQEKKEEPIDFDEARSNVTKNQKSIRQNTDSNNSSPITILDKSKNTLQVTGNTASSTSKEKPSKSDIKQALNITLLNLNPIAPFVYLRKEIVNIGHEIPTAAISISNEKVDQVFSKKMITASLYGGINMHSNNYTSDSIGTLKNDAKRMSIGNTLGVSLSRLIFKNIKGSLAVEYNDLWTKFEINESNSMRVLVKNALIKVLINGQTLDTLDRIYMDTIVNTQYTRTIVHHNNLKTISFPISIGYHWNMNRFELGINAGVVYSMRIYQSGKGYNNQGAIVEYNNHKTIKPFSTLSLAYRLSSVFRYRFNNNISLSLSPQYQFSSGSYYEDSDHLVRSSIWNINIGMSKTF